MVLPLFELEEDSVPVIRLHALPTWLFQPAIVVRTDFRTKGLLLALLHGQDGFDRSMVFGMHWKFDGLGASTIIPTPLPRKCDNICIFTGGLAASWPIHTKSNIIHAQIEAGVATFPWAFSRFDNTLFRTTFGTLDCNWYNTSMKKHRKKHIIHHSNKKTISTICWPTRVIPCCYVFTYVAFV